MKFTYYFLNDYLNKEEIKKINDVFRDKPNNFHKKAPTTKTSTAKEISYDEIGKIKNIEYTISYLNRLVFGFDLYENIYDGVVQNKYTNKGQYKWHYDGEPYDVNFTIKLTTLINVSEKKYTGGKFMIFDGKPLHVKEFDKPGTLICFPSFFLHRVTPVTKGERTTITIFKSGRWWK